ncbi:MAG: hypothetical protein SH856_09415 [Flavobacteriales bacterium]|nr:hypothetical protein [Flavobacteriales bacterium]
MCYTQSQSEPKKGSIRIAGDSTYGIFDTFSSEEGRKAHLAGKVAAALMEKAPDLFSKDPLIEQLNILVVKRQNETVNS